MKAIDIDEVKIIKASAHKNKKVIVFKWNESFYRYTYKFGNGYGFTFINKYKDEQRCLNPLTNDGEQIYSSSQPEKTTEEGVLIEYSIMRWKLILNSLEKL